MNNNFITVVLSFLILGLIGCMVAFGIDAYNNMELSKYKDAAVQKIDEIYSSIEKKEDVSTPQIVEKSIDDVAETFSEEKVNYQSSTARTRYFYNQLDNNSKILYDGILSNIESMKSGVAEVHYGDKFNDLLRQENGQKELGEYYQSAIEAFIYDNPEVFFLDPTKMCLNIETTTRIGKKTYNVYIKNNDGTTYLAKGFTSNEQINQIQLQIEDIKHWVLEKIGNSSTEKKIRFIHDYLIENLNYDQTLSKENIYNLYGALINKECVCEGYAKAFKYLLDEAGVDNTIVIGIGTNTNGETENHAWNYVAIDGKWYAVDVTWDDPILQGGITIPALYKNKYYLKGLQTIGKDHVSKGQFSNNGKIFAYPQLSVSDY